VSLRALFFDVGETLVYAHPSSAEIMAEVCREAGLPVVAEAVEQAEARVAPRIAARQATGELYSISPESSERFWTWVYTQILAELQTPEATRPCLARRLHERFSRLETWRLFPDVRPTLEALRSRRQQNGLVVGIISNWEDWLEALLVQLEIHHYFDFLTISAGVRLEKPDPRIFQAALQRAGARPEEALHVGDSLHADVGGARAAGITPVLIDRRGRYSPEQAQGAAIIRSLDALLPLLDQPPLA